MRYGYPPPPAAPWHSGKCCKALWDMGTPPVDKLTKWNYYLPVVLRTRAVISISVLYFIWRNKKETRERIIFVSVHFVIFCTEIGSLTSDFRASCTNIMTNSYQSKVASLHQTCLRMRIVLWRPQTHQCSGRTYSSCDAHNRVFIETASLVEKLFFRLFCHGQLCSNRYLVPTAIW